MHHRKIAIALFASAVSVGGAGAAQAPASPLTNSAGQVVVSTGC